MHCWWECKSIQPLWRTEGRFLKKLGLKLSYDLIIPLLSIYPKESIIERHMSPLFIVALFTIARTWKQPKWPFTNEWIKKLWYIYTMKHYSVMKRNEFDSVLVRWMNLEPITQSEVNKKDKYHILTYIYMKSIKMVLMNPFAGQQWRLTNTEQTCGHGREGRRGWDKLREQH